MKQKFELQFLLRTSPKILESKISTPSGLSEWFCDDVNVREGIHYFKWDTVEEEALLISHKAHQHIRFQWVTEDSDDSELYFEISTAVDSLTSEISLTVTDFCEPQEKQNSVMLWNQQIAKLKRLIGS